MAPHIQTLTFSLLLILTFSLLLAVKSQVPANKTFRIVNTGEFGEYIVEYDASYRLIRNDVYRFYFTYPFQLCFYNTTPDKFIFALRAGLPRDEDLMRWVWDANRNDPVGENATLTFGRNGNLILADSDGRIAWQTNTANKGVTGIRILGNGNLVLHDRKGKFVWQSFDYPSDTLLVGQSLRLGGRNKLVSRTSDVDGSDGPYSIILERTGFNMYLNNAGKLLIYGGWRFNLGSEVTFNAEPENVNATAYELVLTYNPPPPAPSANRRRLLQSRPIGSGTTINLNKINYNGTLSFLRLGSDGNLKAFTYYPPVGYLLWDETFAFFSNYFVRECALPAKCGKFGYCSRGMCIGCPSPKGILGWSESCSPPVLPPCKSGKKTDYYKVVGVEHFLNTYLNDGSRMKVEDCRKKCDNDCKCVGFFYTGDTSKCLTVPVLATLIRNVNATSVGYIKYSN